MAACSFCKEVGPAIPAPPAPRHLIPIFVDRERHRELYPLESVFPPGPAALPSRAAVIEMPCCEIPPGSATIPCPLLKRFHFCPSCREKSSLAGAHALKTSAVRQMFASKNQLFKHLRVEGSACGVAAGTFVATPLSNKTEKVQTAWLCLSSVG